MNEFHTPRPYSHEESLRLEAFHRTKILDAQSNVFFDAIVREAQQYFQVPVVYISFIDRDRLWFKSRIGVEICEVKRHDSPCAKTLAGTDVHVICDLAHDEQSSPLMPGHPQLRFYAAAPIVIPDGLLLGTLCVMDSKPRVSFSDEERKALKIMAQEVSQLILRLAQMTVQT